MALTSSCRARRIPSRFNFSYRFTDNLHFFYSEPIPAHDVAAAAGGLDVSFNVRKRVIYPIQPSVFCSGSAVNAGQQYKRQNFFRS
jgi:hypothetical protein